MEFNLREFSKITKHFYGQPMFHILNMAQKLEREGKDIIHLELGDPNFDTPSNIVDVACKSLKNQETHYTNSMGLFEFRESIQKATFLSRSFKPNINQILITPGANSIIYFAIKCLVNMDDEVIVPDPGFPTYYSSILACGAKIVRVPLKEENSFRLCAKDLEDKITNKTKLIIINSPSNPTGSVMSKDDIINVSNIAKKHNIYLLSDEIYSRLVYNEEKSFLSPSYLDHCKEFVLILNGFSKAFAMTGWRLGVCIGPENLIEKMGILLETIVSCVPPFIQKAGIEAINGDQSSVLFMKSEYEKRKNVLVKGLNKINNISALNPEGAIYVFANIKKTGFSSEEFIIYALKEAGVALSSGSYFGKYGEGYVRFSCANSIENIQIALDRLKKIF